VNFDTSTATRIDPVSGEMLSVPTGFHPYTYSDFTGYSLLTQFPRGYYRAVIEACEGAEWLLAELDAGVPAGTSVHLRVRTASDLGGLATAPWYGPFTSFPADLAAPPGPVPAGRVLELELVLISDDGLLTPRVRDLVLGHRCPVG
jgi:hypothetical protein